MKEAKDGQVAKLKNQINRKNKEIRNLKSQIRDYEKVLQKNFKFLNESTEDFSLEDLLDAASENTSIKDMDAKRACPKCMSVNYVVIKTPFGEARTCGNCDYRETIKN